MLKITALQFSLVAGDS